MSADATGDDATVLVTGGAGYIGSHTLRALLEAGHRPVVLDNLSSGHAQAVPAEVVLEVADLADEAALERILIRHRPHAVIHFAAFIEAGESMRDPARFYQNNVRNTLNLLEAMRRHGMETLVFSSSAGVYGDASVVPIPESAPLLPVNTYGWTKRMIEQVLVDYGRAYGLRSLSLRYFNACGAHRSGEIGEAHRSRTHLIELALLTQLGQHPVMKVFGTDYSTPDGSCIRDYVHVSDLAHAHVLGLEALVNAHPERPLSPAYNVGLGQGFSVLEVLRAVEEVTGRPLPRQLEGRRSGDPPVLVADARLIQQELGWKPRHTSLVGMIESAWQWHKNHVHGFESG